MGRLKLQEIETHPGLWIYAYHIYGGRSKIIIHYYEDKNSALGANDLTSPNAVANKHKYVKAYLKRLRAALKFH